MEDLARLGRLPREPVEVVKLAFDGRERVVQELVLLQSDFIDPSPPSVLLALNALHLTLSMLSVSISSHLASQLELGH